MYIYIYKPFKGNPPKRTQIMDLAPFWSLFLSFPFISERKPTKTYSNHGFGSVLIRLAAFPFISFHFGKEAHHDLSPFWWVSFPKRKEMKRKERKWKEKQRNGSKRSQIHDLSPFLWVSFPKWKEMKGNERKSSKTDQNGTRSMIWVRFGGFPFRNERIWKE